MTATLQLREKRANVWAQAQEFAERSKKGEPMSAEDEASWSRALAEVDSLGVTIDNLERTSDLDSKFRAVDDATQTLDTRGGKGNIDEYRETFTQFLRNGAADLNQDQRKLLQANLRAQSTTGSAGGYTIPQGFWAKVTETMKYYGGVLLAGAEVINTDSGNTIPWPTADDTSNVGAILSENSTIPGQDVTFGQADLGAYMYTSKLILVSYQLLQDTGIDIEAFIARRVGERLGRIYNTHQTTGLGSGSTQPKGFVTGATTGKTSAASAAITYNELIDLVHSVDVAYRMAPAADVCFQMNDLVLAYVRKIRDDIGGAGLGRPIWEPSIQVGVPDQLLGYRVVVNNDMASSLVTTAKSVAFGNFRAGFVVRNVNGGELKRLEERYADNLQVGFFGFGRMDSEVQDTSAFKLLVQV